MINEVVHVNDLSLDDIFNLDKKLSDIDISNEHINLEQLNEDVIRLLSAYLFKLYSTSINNRDGLVYIKNLINTMIVDIDNINTPGDIMASITNDVDRDRVDKELNYIIPTFKRLRMIYGDLFLKLGFASSERAYKLIVSLREGLLTTNDLDSFFDEKLDISRSIEGYLFETEPIERFIIREIKDCKFFNKITIEDIYSKIDRANNLLESSNKSRESPIYINMIIFKRSGDRVERVRYSEKIKGDPVFNYTVYVLITEEIDGVKEVRAEKKIHDMCSYRKFKSFINVCKDMAERGVGFE